MDTYVFAGGGSGGHLFPAIAVARELLRRDPEARIVFVGGQRPVDAHILGHETFERRVIRAASSADLRRNPLRFAWRNWRGYREAVRWLRGVQPRVVVGCGGYASVPAALASSRLTIPLVLLEQNVVPGRATSCLARRAAAVCTSFEETTSLLPAGSRVVVTGNPVRAEIAALAHRGFPFTASRAGEGASLLLVLGGSQGAGSVNRGVLEFVAAHRDRLAGWRIVHQTGRHDEADIRTQYAAMGIDAQVYAFITGMTAAYREADVVVSRAGATTLAELACAGLPAVLVPYPGAVRDHQQRNAEVFVRAGAAVCATDGSTDELAAGLLPLLMDAGRRAAMSVAAHALARPDATDRVVELIESASGGV